MWMPCSLHNSFISPATNSLMLLNITVLMFLPVPFSISLTHFSNSIGVLDMALKRSTQLTLESCPLAQIHISFCWPIPQALVQLDHCTSSNGSVVQIHPSLSGVQHAFINAQDGQLSSFRMSSGEFSSITLVAAPLAMSIIVFILQCPIHQCQSYRLTGFSPSPVIYATKGLLQMRLQNFALMTWQSG